MSSVIKNIKVLLLLISMTSPNFATSKSLHLEHEVQGVKVYFEFVGGTSHAVHKRMQHLFEQVYSEHLALFGGPPRDSVGNACKEIKVSVKSSVKLGGEAEPCHISLKLSDAELFGFYSWEIVLIHEMLHLWSAESFRYATGGEQWFNEGGTDYLAIGCAIKLGLIQRNKVISVLASFLGYYISSEGLGELSLSEAGSTPKLKRKYYFLVYRGGFMATFMLDYLVRTNTDGNVTIEDLMKKLYQEYNRKHKYSNDSIRVILEAISLVDFKPFFSDYILGTESYTSIWCMRHFPQAASV